MAESAAVRLSRVSKSFGKLKAVQNLSLSVKPGSVYFLIGPNGSGKTTTIKMMTGILRPDSGNISIFGSDIVKNPVAAKKDLGFIPDDPFAYDKLSGREFLYLTAALYGIPTKERKEKIDQLLALFPIADNIDANFEGYSRGTKQKLMVLSTLLHSPKFIVIDEPIVGLDPKSADIFLGLVRKLKKEGAAFFISTHTLSVADALADRIGIIKDGKLIAEGTPKELRRKVKKGSASLTEIYHRLTG